MALPIVQVVGDLYGCLLSDAPIPAALDVLCSALGAAHAIVMRSGPDRGDMLVTSHHLASIRPAQLGNLNHSDEYRRLLANVAIGSAVRMTDLVPRDIILGTEMYQTTLRPLDGGLAVYGLQLDGSDMVVTAICRSAAIDPDFDDDSVALVRAVLPHLVSIVGVATRMERERRDGQHARDALDIVGDGVIMLGAMGQVVHINAMAEVLLASGDRIRRTRTGIVATQRTDDVRLQRAIRAVRSFDRGFDDHDKAVAAGQPFELVLGRRVSGWPLIVTVMPATRMVNRMHDAAIVIRLRDPGSGSPLSMVTLGREFGLTPREATLVLALADGATLVQAACRMEISIGTARQYLKTIFDKTGVCGQADLVRLVCG